MKKAHCGVQSRNNVISAWPFLSSSGTTVYEVQLHDDGVLTCSCPGWVNYSSRSCKHVKAKMEQATAILSGIWKLMPKEMFQPGVFEKYEPFKPDPVVKRTGRLIRMG